MKKRALILAMIAFVAATTSEPSINMVRAEETQVEETQTEENAGCLLYTSGDATATAWGCDLTYDYIKINADYRS